MRFLSIILISFLMLHCETINKVEPRHRVKLQTHKYVSSPIKIAIIDTGFGWSNGFIPEAKLCDSGHKDFTGLNQFSPGYDTVDSVPKDNLGHGTNIAGIIQLYAGKGKKDFCLVILKFYDPELGTSENLRHEIEAIRYATELKVDFINMSVGGGDYSPMEALAVKNFLDQGGQFVAAAGNENWNIDLVHYYPAMDDDRVIVVGNGASQNHKSNTSNYGDRVDVWEIGTQVVGFGIVMTGTSQSTAIVTGKMVAAEKMSVH